ncbi:glycosyltransferase [Rhodococcus antarcticus]|uniref:Glycosyltransferase n=1 Tax=Rhodococcus antarcticus TaxID=2987751 RepID=A0ABY6P4X6_9NOCA|nr:glycosyltransferase [Rhodococcus antarcticus]UZJ26715.1 glycosyltransferase [Rhodococcus antarcticus]
MTEADRPHRISVVVPVYQGERTLRPLVDELLPWTRPSTSPAGHPFVVEEVLLVFDHGPDGSAQVIRELVAAHPVVRAVWLSRNFGQHPATLAGMASTGGEWIVTLDEDGQHDPAAIGDLLDTALERGASVVYAQPSNPAPHGLARNTASRGAKWLVAKALAGDAAPSYQSYRLVLGEVGRSVAAYAGNGVYLDVALGWIAGEVATCPVALREEGGRRSGYSYRTLLSHFWRMVLSSGTKGLRLVSVLGAVFAVFGVLLAFYILAARLFFDANTGSGAQGWTSTVVIVLLSTGAILFSLGIIAEYVGVNVNMAMGKPPYLIVSDPHAGPLGRAGRGGAGRGPVPDVR